MYKLYVQYHCYRILSIAVLSLEGLLMRSLYEKELRSAAAAFADLLQTHAVSVQLDEVSFRDYSVKLLISYAGVSYGSLVMYYSPKRNNYRIAAAAISHDELRERILRLWDEYTGIAPPPQNGVIAYVDGSYRDDTASYGAVIIKDGIVVKELSGKTEQTIGRGARQVAGELDAVLHVLQWCDENGISELTIAYDMKGIAEWARGTWQTKSPVTQAYAASVHRYKKNITWHKIAAHTGARWNEHADKLARAALSK